jgi:hypothetical protein
MKNKKQTEFSCGYTSLSSLLDSIKAAGYTEKDYSNFEFETDYSGCYYEGDTPSIVCKYNE